MLDDCYDGVDDADKEGEVDEVIVADGADDDDGYSPVGSDDSLSSSSGVGRARY